MSLEQQAVQSLESKIPGGQNLQRDMQIVNDVRQLEGKQPQQQQSSGQGFVQSAENYLLGQGQNQQQQSGQGQGFIQSAEKDLFGQGQNNQQQTNQGQGLIQQAENRFL